MDKVGVAGVVLDVSKGQKQILYALRNNNYYNNNNLPLHSQVESRRLSGSLLGVDVDLACGLVWSILQSHSQSAESLDSPKGLPRLTMHSPAEQITTVVRSWTPPPLSPSNSVPEGAP